MARRILSCTSGRVPFPDSGNILGIYVGDEMMSLSQGTMFDKSMRYMQGDRFNRLLIMRIRRLKDRNRLEIKLSESSVTN